MLKTLIVNLVISLGVGGLSSILTKDSMDIYSTIALPPFAPPSSLFPIIWTILYILMAISATIIYRKSPTVKGLVIYAVQLLVNFIWPLIFFDGRMFFASFLWLMLLWVLVLWMIVEFYKVDHIAAYIQIPYVLWLTFAAVLNWSVFALNSGNI